MFPSADLVYKGGESHHIVLLYPKMFLQSALLENRVDVVSRDECDVDHPAEQSQDVGQQ